MPWDFRDFLRQIEIWPQHQTFLVQLYKGRDGAHKLIVFQPGDSPIPNVTLPSCGPVPAVRAE